MKKKFDITKPLRENFKIYLLFPFFLGGLLFFFSCGRYGPCDPSPRMMAIELVDKNDSLLIGKTYNPDSIRLTVDNTRLSIMIQHGQIQLFYAGLDIYNEANYFLYLSKSTTDTLKLTVSKHHNKCGDYYDFDGLTYNSKNISPVPNTDIVFKIIK